MKKLSKKIWIALSLAFICLISAIGFTYAYFSNKSSQEATAQTTLDDSQVVEIASFSDLFANAKNTKKNDENQISNSSSRTILRLTKDVSLIDDLQINNDIHFDLNGYTLYLQDHILTFSHAYQGTLLVYNGTIDVGDNGLGYIVADLENASFVTNSLALVKGDTSLEASSYIRVTNMEQKYTSYKALSLVGEAINSSLNNHASTYNYDEVMADSFTFEASKFIPTMESSAYHSSSEACSYVYKDLILPEYYLSKDITITYTSSNTTYLSNGGRIVSLPDEEVDVTLTASISYSAWESPITCTFSLHLVNLNNAAALQNVGQSLIKDYLSSYYQNRALGDIFSDYYYAFDHQLLLPKSVYDNKITFTYATYDIDKTKIADVTDTSGNSYIFEPSNDSYYLGVTICDDTSNSMELQMYSTLVGGKETIVWLLINKMYGGSIIFDSNSSYKSLYTYSEVASNEDTKDIISEYNITNISYALKEGSDAYSTYLISDNKITIQNGQTPEVKEGYISVSFEFNSSTIETIDVYIEYLDESGNSISSFMAYYGEYDASVSSSITYEMTMPFAYNKTGSPYTVYDFVSEGNYQKKTVTLDGNTYNYYSYSSFDLPSYLQVILYYNGAERFTFSSYSGSESMSSQLDSYLSSNSLTLSDIASYGDAEYIFRIDTQSVASEDVKCLLIYNYKFKESSSWNQFIYVNGDNTYQTESTVSQFTITGGLFYNASSSATNAIKDENFFTWIYNNYTPNGDSLDTSKISETIIPSSWLLANVSLDVSSDSTLNDVSDFTGIQNLKSLTYVNLSEKTITSDIITSISTLKSISTLVLSSCSISDISSFTSLTSVKSLDISNNSIDYFDALTSMTSLEEVYLYGNDGTYTGSKGICNFQTFEDVMRNGTSVYNSISEGVPVLYANSDSLDDYRRLKEIAYQTSLSKDVSITTLYESFSSLSALSLNLTDGSGTLSWGYEDGATEYNATYFYCKYTFSSYTLTVKYYVERY